ncbi:hypothetical protein [Microbacterium tenebrionis]|uniref:hypothetical protein n=1 Tax=Microbacterium tenebrionis TaxID=2830665 RepID=UPI001D0D3186|nr:hypothetical protein [Microbacterium tenebrionis]
MQSQTPRATLRATLNRRSIGVRAAGAGAALLLGVVGLSACTNGDSEPSPSPSASSTLTPGITDITDTPGSGENLVGALADATVSTCELGDGSWTVDGTVKNPTKDSVSYRIYVSLLNEAGDTRSLSQVDVDGVGEGAEEEWATTVDLTDEDLTCVLRVERYAAAG